jgi:hypothetical protein
MYSCRVSHAANPGPDPEGHDYDDRIDRLHNILSVTMRIRAGTAVAQHWTVESRPWHRFVICRMPRILLQLRDRAMHAYTLGSAAGRIKDD